MTAGAVRLRRLFFALWPDDGLRDGLRRAHRALVRHCGGRPVPPANYHLTLAFLGGVPDERLEEVCAIGRARLLPPLVLRLDRLGYFDGPQALWVGPGLVPEQLADLAADLARGLIAAGLPVDPRPFHPHLTLARKVAAPPEMRPPRAVEWAVGGYALVESTTAPSGSRYRVVAGFPEPAENPSKSGDS